ncbi:porin [Enhygromyxa salina]|uniref:Phosphate-selective porin O and P n=1 Tax=Enhygromyxa salina TaxID=215803 RepID=A0A2S9YPH7_9BACT|nr:porin [Enhygromyxa salina]PRQ06996.1 hypothetical protein ENSA7_33300 [Enhygromyxa salina]
MGQLSLILGLALTLAPPSSAPSDIVEITSPQPPAPSEIVEVATPAPPASELAQPVETTTPSPALAPAPVANPDADAAVEGAEQPDEDKQGKPDSEAKKAKKPKKYEFKVGARVIAGGRLRYIEPRLDSEGSRIGQPERKGSLQLRQARVKVSAKYLDVLSAKVSLEFSDLLGSPSAGDVLRDAWGNVQIHPGFQIKVGHFKRPYSRLELRGVSKVPMIGRGLYNSVAIEDLSWGDRAVGVALWGKLEPMRPGLHELGWSISASNNALAGAPNGVDAHARVTYDPTAWLSIGAGGAFKHVQDSLANEADCLAEWKRDASCRRNVFGATFDLVFRVKGLYASVETNLAQDWLFAETSPWMLGALAYATYDFEVGKKTRLQPIVSGEFIDTNLSFSESEALRGVAGLNILWTKRLRVMPQAQYVMPMAPVTSFNHFVESWVVGLWVSVQL